MSLWTEHLNVLAHYDDLLREAEQRRLVHQALEGRPKHQAHYRRVSSWLADRLSAFGSQLKERRGQRAASPVWVEKHAH